MRDILFTAIAFRQYTEWQTMDKTIYSKLNSLILETAQTPFTGTGKPEPLKHELKGYWSRRINQEHRLVYAVEPERIRVIACMYHYK